MVCFQPIEKFTLFQYKQAFEKVGEATETALIVLAEKLNPFGISKSGLSRRDAALAVNQNIQSVWKKDFTLEFSRDRKSMSVHATPTKPSRLGTGPKMFIKVSYLLSFVACLFLRILDYCYFRVLRRAC